MKYVSKGDRAWHKVVTKNAVLIALHISTPHTPPVTNSKWWQCLIFLKHVFCLSTSIIELICSFIFLQKSKCLVRDSTVLHILLLPSYLTLSLLCLTFALQSCLLTVFVNVTFISTALHLLMLFLIPEMLSIYRTPSSNLNLTNQCLLLCDNLY